MLEGQRDLEREQGFRGPATRFFGPIDSVADARTVLQEMCIGLLLFSVAVGASAIRVRPVAAIAGAAVIAVPALLLLRSRNRFVAAALFLIVASEFVILIGLNWIRGLFPLLYWIAAISIAGRASRAAFRLHQFMARPTVEAIDGA
jgi:hypothetical protein